MFFIKVTIEENTMKKSKAITKREIPTPAPSAWSEGYDPEKATLEYKKYFEKHLEYRANCEKHTEELHSGNNQLPSNSKGKTPKRTLDAESKPGVILPARIPAYHIPLSDRSQSASEEYKKSSSKLLNHDSNEGTSSGYANTKRRKL